MQFERHPSQERHVQIIRKGSEKLWKCARVVVVSYDLMAQNDRGLQGVST